jgi:hypothetical protein
VTADRIGPCYSVGVTFSGCYGGTAENLRGRDLSSNPGSGQFGYLATAKGSTGLRNIGGGVPWEVREPASILLRPHWGPVVSIEMPETNQGGHGGGDQRLLRDVFEGAEADPLGRAAGHVDGALSILTGIAANQSMATGQPVRVRDLLDLRG